MYTCIQGFGFQDGLMHVVLPYFFPQLPTKINVLFSAFALPRRPPSGAGRASLQKKNIYAESEETSTTTADDEEESLVLHSLKVKVVYPPILHSHFIGWVMFNRKHF